ncbi:MAG: metal-dependent hydrolase [Cellulosilyticaceae bacterium]
MTYRTHILGGVVLSAVAGVYVWPQTGGALALCTVAAGVGALLPDIDHPNSWLSNHVGILRYPFKVFGHRGATHSLLATLIVFAIIGGIFKGGPITLGMTLGYLSHLLLDMLNPRGVPLFYPFTKEKYKIARIHTGEGGEQVVFVLLVLALMMIVILFFQKIWF